MRYFIVGDIHGCYYTLRELISKHWDTEVEKLVLLGDLVNKGKHTFAVLEYVLKLVDQYQNKIIILKGNNEYLFEKYYRQHITLATKQKFENYNLDYSYVLNWMDNLPIYYVDQKVFFSHAGVPKNVDKEDYNDSLELMFNKSKLQNIQKTQFLGHVVVDKPTYDKKANAWYLDTGAGNGKKLTGVKISSNKGEIEEIVSIKVNPKDIP